MLSSILLVRSGAVRASFCSYDYGKNADVFRVFRLWRRLFHKAFRCSSFSAQPPSDQRDPQWERGARCALSCYHRSHAGPQKAGPVFDGTPGMIQPSQNGGTWIWLLCLLWVPNCGACVSGLRESWRRNCFRLKTATRTRKENSLKPRNHSQMSSKGYDIF